MFVIVILIQVAVALLVEQITGGGRGLVLGMLLMMLTPALLRARDDKLQPLDPEMLVPLAFFLSAGYAPTVHLITSARFSLAEREVDALSVAFVGAVACALVTTIWSRVPGRAAESEPDPTDVEVTFLDVAAIITGLVGLAMIGAYIGMVGVGVLLKMSYSETYVAEDGLGVLISGWMVIQFAAVYLSTRCLTIHRTGARIPRLLLAGVILFVLCFFWNTVLGRRGPVVYLFLSMAISAHASKLVLRWRWAALALVIIGFYGFAIEGARSKQGEDVGAQVAAARHGLESVDNPLVIPELEAVWNNLVIVVAYQPPIVEYPGESLSIAVLMLIPRPLWGDRPLGLAQRFVVWFDPVAARTGAGYAFNAAAEGYLNGGHAGAGVEVALMTALFFGPFAASVRRRRSPYLQTLAACITANAYYQFRGEAASLVKLTFTFAAAMALTMIVEGVLRAVASEVPAQPAEPGPRPA